MRIFNGYDGKYTASKHDLELHFHSYTSAVWRNPDKRLIFQQIKYRIIYYFFRCFVALCCLMISKYWQPIFKQMLVLSPSSLFHDWDMCLPNGVNIMLWKLNTTKIDEHLWFEVVNIYETINIKCIDSAMASHFIGIAMINLQRWQQIWHIRLMMLCECAFWHSAEIFVLKSIVSRWFFLHLFLIDWKMPN